MLDLICLQIVKSMTQDAVGNWTIAMVETAFAYHGMHPAVAEAPQGFTEVAQADPM